MLRSTHIIQAKDERSHASAMEFEQQIRDGVPTVILAEDIAGGGMDVYQTPAPANATTELINLVQFITSRYYSELGITLNNNMKSQYVSETELNKSTGMPLIYNMLACRQEAVDEINALFGRDIKVVLSEEWNDELEKDSDPVAPAEETPEAPVEETPADDTPDASAEEEPVEETPEAPVEETPEAPVEETPGETPEETHSAEEVKGAADALIGEENVPTDDSASDDTDSESDTDEDDEEGRAVEAEEDDDEG